MPQPQKDKDNIDIRMTLDDEMSYHFRIVQKWMGAGTNTEVVRFCINQVYHALKEGKITILNLE